MRHLNHRHTLGLRQEHRAAVLANLSAALISRRRIQTTLAKAKALRPFVERIITLAKKAHGASPERALHLRRQAIAKVRDVEVVGKLFNEGVTEFLDRQGGYSRIYKTGHRGSDAAEMAIIMLVPREDEGYSRKRKPSGVGASAGTLPAADADGPAAAAAPSEVSAGDPEAKSETERG